MLVLEIIFRYAIKYISFKKKTEVELSQTKMYIEGSWHEEIPREWDKIWLIFDL